MRLAEPIEFGVHAYPICKPDVDKDFESSKGTVAGWGEDESGSKKHLTLICTNKQDDFIHIWHLGRSGCLLSENIPFVWKKKLIMP